MQQWVQDIRQNEQRRELGVGLPQQVIQWHDRRAKRNDFRKLKRIAGGRDPEEWRQQEQDRREMIGQEPGIFQRVGEPVAICCAIATAPLAVARFQPARSPCATL